MWTLHDFPAYGLLSGLTTKGFKACPVCGPRTISRRSKILRKNIYCNCHRRYLPADHYFRGADAAFDGVACHEMEGEPLTGNQTIRHGRQSERYIEGGGTEKDSEFPGKVHGVKRVSALYQLPYWRVCLLHWKLCFLSHVYTGTDRTIWSCWNNFCLTWPKASYHAINYHELYLHHIACICPGHSIKQSP